MTLVDTEIERQQVVGPELLVEALNSFFAATDRAGIPTILVLDDFDEFASNVGPSHEQRAQALAGVLGQFNQLRPTCLLIGLREEYMHEDIRRQYTVIYVPPLTRADARLVVDAWARVQRPSLQTEIAPTPQAIGDLFLRYFPEDARVVVPFRYLQLVTWIANHMRDWRKRRPREILLDYLGSSFTPEVVRALSRVCEIMPPEDVRLCAEAVPLDPAPYALSSREERALKRAGLLRPAIAGDPEDTSLVVDPLCAYLCAALQADAPPAG